MDMTPWIDRLPLAASLVFAVLIAYQLADVTWSLVAPQAPVADVAASAAPTPPPDPGRIAARHLFGEASAIPTAAATIDAPDTRLDLTLRGIAASESPQLARALIASPDGEEDVYAVGAEVPGGASVYRIQADRVLLNRRGTLETLRLPEFGDSGDAPELAQPVAEAAVDNLRNQAAVDQLVEVVRPQAVMVNGELRGFRVYPGRDRERFAQLGLRAGDLVTAVNGVPLTNPTESLSALQALTSNTEVNLTVQRGDQVETVSIRPDL